MKGAVNGYPVARTSSEQRRHTGGAHVLQGVQSHTHINCKGSVLEPFQYNRIVSSAIQVRKKTHAYSPRYHR